MNLTLTNKPFLAHKKLLKSINNKKIRPGHLVTHARIFQFGAWGIRSKINWENIIRELEKLVIFTYIIFKKIKQQQFLCWKIQPDADSYAHIFQTTLYTIEGTPPVGVP